jgi:conjugative transposon TraN protein
MKKYIYLLVGIIATNIAIAQTKDSTEIKKIKSQALRNITGIEKKSDLTDLFITDDLSIHFRSPEPIKYVDLSSHLLVGDLPVDNVLRIKYVSDSIGSHYVPYTDNEVGVVTIVGESYLVQYKILYTKNKNLSFIASEIEVLPQEMKPLQYPSSSLTTNELKKYSYDLLKRKPSFQNVTSKGVGLKLSLNNIYAFGDFIFVDVAFKNNTNIKYDINQVRFKIEDKKIFKATNVQELEIKPEFILYKNKSFRNNFRNIYVFKKFTYPNSKVLNIQLTEEQISGRMIELKIDYKDLLNADTL